MNVRIRVHERPRVSIHVAEARDRLGNMRKRLFIGLIFRSPSEAVELRLAERKADWSSRSQSGPLVCNGVLDSMRGYRCKSTQTPPTTPEFIFLDCLPR